MSVATNKLMNLGDGQVLYNDLRDKYDPLIPTNTGTEGQVLRCDGAGGVEWDDNASAEEIASEVTSWLDEHVTQGETLVVDNSLSVAGAAADAKVAGDELNSLKSAFDIYGAENRLPNQNASSTPGLLTVIGNNGVFTISGTTTGTGYTHADIYNNASTFPDGIGAGMQLQFTHVCSDSNVVFRFFERVNDAYVETVNIPGNGTKTITVNSAATGCIIRLSVANGNTYSNVKSHPIIMGTLTKQQTDSRLKALELSNDRYYPYDVNNNYRTYIANAFVNKAYGSGTVWDSNIRAIHIQKLNDGTIVYFNKALYSGTYMVVNPSTMALLITNKGWNTTGKMVIDTEGLVDYTVIIQFKDASNESNTVDVVTVSKNVTILERNNIADLWLFIGQSNMAGRGATSTSYPQTAPNLYECAGLEFRAITDQTRLYPIAEPFGYAENKVGGINDGTSKTGGMVTAFVNTYYTKTGMQVVGVSASEGGTNISQWASGSDRLNDAIQRLSDAIAYLTAKGYMIRHKYMLWCQGESDTRAEITPEQHKTYFDGIQSALMSAGIEKCFMVRIGEYNGETYDYSPIINIQTQIAQTDPDVVMASTILASFKDRGMMKDEWHYYQAAYNETGWYAGANAAFYVNNNKEPTMYDPKSNNLYYCHKN